MLRTYKTHVRTSKPCSIITHLLVPSLGRSGEPPSVAAIETIARKRFLIAAEASPRVGCFIDTTQSRRPKHVGAIHSVIAYQTGEGTRSQHT